MNSNSVNFSVRLGKASGDFARDRCEWRARQYHRDREACEAESAFPPFSLNVHWLSFVLLVHVLVQCAVFDMGRGHIAHRCISEIPRTIGQLPATIFSRLEGKSVDLRRYSFSSNPREKGDTALQEAVRETDWEFLISWKIQVRVSVQ